MSMTSATAMGGTVAVSFGGETRRGVARAMALAVGDELKAKYPTLPGIPEFASEDGAPALGEFSVVMGDASPAVTRVTALSSLKVSPPPAAGEVDAAARARIDAQHAALGIAERPSEQFFDSGTRMMDAGYEVQEARRRQYERKLPLRQIVDALRDRIGAEKRHDELVTCAQLADSLHVNGKVTMLGGYAVTEQAIRGLMVRSESPALGYLLGLRNRIAAEVAKGDAKNPTRIREDKQRLAEVLGFELRRVGDVPVKMRLRDQQRDAYAAVSPKYAPADAPEVAARVIDKLPADVRGSFSYDPASTAWELRASLWTPTPVDEQAVGEAFEGFASFTSRDDGGASLTGGGGVLMLRCLNASTYVALDTRSRRRHVGTIVLDVVRMAEQASDSIGRLCRAWGIARDDELEPAEVDDAPIPLEMALPGYFRSMLGDRKSEVYAVLPGRMEKHAEALAKVFPSERRDGERLVRADLAQAFTRYAQGFEAPVQREAERAVGAWLVAGRPVRYEA